MLQTLVTDPVSNLRIKEAGKIRKYPLSGSHSPIKGLRPGPYLVQDEYGNCGYRMVEADPKISDFCVFHVPGLFDVDNETLLSHLNVGRVFTILDPAMATKLYIEKICNYLYGHNIDHVLLPLEKQQRNEMNKTHMVITDLVARIATHEPMKHDAILVIGGGVTKDVGAYLASTFRRSMLPYLVVPTTLTCMVDAAISPKTSLNISGYKNILGTVYAPSTVLYDPAVLRTLDNCHLSAGMAEIVKIAVVRSAGLFRCLEDHGVRLLRTHFQGPVGSAIIDLAILLFLKMKYEPPFPGNKPASLRAFGHFFSRRLEQLCNYEMEHGEAVAVEICVATNLAFMAGILPWTERERILSLLRELNLPSQCSECTPRKLWSLFERRLKSEQNFYFPIPGERIGRGKFLNRLSFDELAEAIHFLPESQLQVGHCHVPQVNKV